MYNAITIYHHHQHHHHHHHHHHHPFHRCHRCHQFRVLQYLATPHPQEAWSPSKWTKRLRFVRYKSMSIQFTFTFLCHPISSYIIVYPVSSYVILYHPTVYQHVFLNSTKVEKIWDPKSQLTSETLAADLGKERNLDSQLAKLAGVKLKEVGRCVSKSCGLGHGDPKVHDFMGSHKIFHGNITGFHGNWIW